MPRCDAARYSTGMVGKKDRPTVFAGGHRIGLGFAGQPRRGEDVAYLDTLDGIDTHHRDGQLAVELRIKRRSPARGHAFGHAFDDRAHRGAGLARVIDDRLPSPGRGGVGTEKWILIDRRIVVHRTIDGVAAQPDKICADAGGPPS